MLQHPARISEKVHSKKSFNLNRQTLSSIPYRPYTDESMSDLSQDPSPSAECGAVLPESEVSEPREKKLNSRV